ncbi:MAG: Coq4 family protein [Gammaproteobacteria bacterium]|nr:Coq4 family protein [Gammaproteobacteria bacterium]
MKNTSETVQKTTLAESNVNALASSWLEKVRQHFARVRELLKSIRALLINPDDTEKAFEIIGELRGKELRKSFSRFQNSVYGNKILQKQVDLIDVLNDRKTLTTLDENSLGRVYLKFIDANQLSPDGLVDASADTYPDIQDENVLRYAQRNRDSHDLWHTLTQYGRDPLGELCLLAFTYAQTQNSGVGLIALIGSFRFYRIYGHGTFGAIWRAYRDGKQASWLPEQPFEDMLSLNIEHVRIMLSIPPPTAYLLVMSRQR